MSHTWTVHLSSDWHQCVKFAMSHRKPSGFYFLSTGNEWRDCRLENNISERTRRIWDTKYSIHRRVHNRYGLTNQSRAPILASPSRENHCALPSVVPHASVARAVIFNFGERDARCIRMQSASFIWNLWKRSLVEAEDPPSFVLPEQTKSHDDGEGDKNDDKMTRSMIRKRMFTAVL